MKKMYLTERGYEAPAVQLLDFAVEQGFANSVTGGPIDSWGDDEDDLNA